MTDPLLDTAEFDPNRATDGADGDGAAAFKDEQPRQRYRLEDDTGFNEVPKKYRRFYRIWGGEGDEMAANEVLCPVCKVVIRSTRELRVGERLYCMACMSRLVVVEGEGGPLETSVVH